MGWFNRCKHQWDMKYIPLGERYPDRWRKYTWARIYTCLLCNKMAGGSAFTSFGRPEESEIYTDA